MMTPFAHRLAAWQARHGRNHLPWQGNDPYRVWLSEIMLQQTQVATVLQYYPRFLARFPDVESLAAAADDDVLALWSGLGYYSRARNLHHAARQVMDEYGGQFPRDRAGLETLKGVGRSTAAAIAVFAFGQKEAILDGNVKRLLARHAGIYGTPDQPATLAALWAEAEARLPDDAATLRRYTQGLMDLGNGICTRTRPRCGECPVAADCYAYRHDATAALPEKRAKKPNPERHTVMLLARCSDRLHLYRRPDRGIWRGLWSLPEYDSVAAAETAVVTNAGRDYRARNAARHHPQIHPLHPAHRAICRDHCRARPRRRLVAATGGAGERPARAGAPPDRRPFSLKPGESHVHP